MPDRDMARDTGYAEDDCRLDEEWDQYQANLEYMRLTHEEALAWNAEIELTNMAIHMDYKNILCSPFGRIPKRPVSHKGAQGFIYQDMIREEYGSCDIGIGQIDFDSYETAWIYLGNDYSPGGLNMFGGVYGFGGLDHLIEFSKFKGKIITLLHDFPPLHEQLQDKIASAEIRVAAGLAKGKVVQPGWYDVDWDNLERMWKESTTVVHPHISKSLVIGDSHSICMYQPGVMVNSVPFQTLNGALKKGLETFIPEEAGKLDKIECYFGNIDIRHHICRLADGVNDDMVSLVMNLAGAYIHAAHDLATKTGAEVWIYQLLPIENESRKIPGSGHYKGKPFWGSWQQRATAREVFNDYLCMNFENVIEWTDYLINPAGELDFVHMEKPRSVHLARSSYPYWKGPSDTGNFHNLFN